MSVQKTTGRVCHSMLCTLLSVSMLAVGSATSPLGAGEIADVIEQARITGGIVVLVGGSDASYEDAADSKCTVHGLEADDARVRGLRTRLQAEGRYGRVLVSPFGGPTLPYIDNLVNLVAIENGSVAEVEAMRVLAPRGIALIRKDGAWVKKVKPVPDDVDEWNQYLHDADNNGVSADRVGPPERLRWTGGTRWGRSHMSWVTVTSMLSASYAGQQGGVLWTASAKDGAKIAEHQLPAQPVFEELFNLKDDPKEQHNLAADPNYADVLAAHRKRCQQLVTELARSTYPHRQSLSWSCQECPSPT